MVAPTQHHHCSQYGFPNPTVVDGGFKVAVGRGNHPDIDLFRYATDEAWLVPHFEKMLYDNGPLLALYAQACLATGDERFAAVANATADWMLSDMQSPEGGFYATRDADSEGEEGLYYLWTPDEVRERVGDGDYAFFASRFGLDEPANFEGRWHLTVRRPIEDVAADAGIPESDALAAIERGKTALLAELEQHECPFDPPPPRSVARAARWIRPEPVVQVAFAELKDRLERIMPELPDEVEQLWVRRWDENDIPIIFGGFTFDPQPHEQPADLRFRGLAGHHRFEDFASVLLAEIVALCEGGQRCLYVHVSASSGSF